MVRLRLCPVSRNQGKLTLLDLHGDAGPPKYKRGIMGIVLSSDIRQLLDRPNFAHLSTLMADGSPQSAPVWVGREADRIVICTSENSLKGRNTRRDPRVALSIIDF